MTVIYLTIYVIPAYAEESVSFICFLSGVVDPGYCRYMV